MNKVAAENLSESGSKALELMEEALGLLDRFDAAMEVGAHLDLAISRLRDVLTRANRMT